MKQQLLLITSTIIIIFAVACSGGKTTTPLTAQGTSQKTIADLEKLSTDEELLKLKKDLEKNPNVQVPDVIDRVKKVFGSNQNFSKQPVSHNENPEIQEKQLSDTKTTMQPTSIEVLTVDVSSNPSEIWNSKVEGDETKHICIRTCEIQIIVIRELEDSGKLSAVSVYVAVELAKKNMEISNSTKQNKTVESLVAHYEVASDTMNLKLEMTKQQKEMILITKNFTYNSKSFQNIEFYESNGRDNGIISVADYGETRRMNMHFSIEEDRVNILLKEDMGLFGKRISKNSQSEQADADTFSRY